MPLDTPGTAGFLRGFVNTTMQAARLKLAQDAQNIQLAAQKDRLKLESARLKGLEATQELKNRELALKVEQAAQAFQRQQQMMQALSGGAAAPTPSVTPEMPGDAAVRTLPGPTGPQPPQQVQPLTPTGDAEFDVLSQRIDQLDTMVTRLLPFSTTEEGNRALDNAQAQLNSLRQRQRDILGDQRRPGERREKLRVSIRGENQVKLLQGAQQAFNVIQGGQQSDSNFGDLAMINGFARLLDPGSVVRPAEFATVEGARALRARLEGFARRLATGERLLPRERRAVVATAKRVMQRYIDIVNREVVPVWGPIAQDAGLQINELLIVPEGFKLSQRGTPRQTPRITIPDPVRGAPKNDPLGIR